MTKLTAKEQDLLQRVEQNSDLRPLFFQKVKGLKWFDAFYEKGYFDPARNPEPVPAEEEGYINVPNWDISDYLVKTAPELSEERNNEYSEKFVKILLDATNYAKENNFSNYRTWWQFSEVISLIPCQFISKDDLEIIDYWLDDKYERSLVAQIIGEKWLPALLITRGEHALELSLKILEYIYKIIIVDKDRGGRTRPEITLRFDYHYAQKITQKIAATSGLRLGIDAIRLFDTQLKYIVDEQENDSWSAVWRPAIEDHSQNKYRDDAEHILVQAYRDSLCSYIKDQPDEACCFVNQMLESNYQIIHRLAIHAIGKNYQILSGLTGCLLNEKYLGDKYRHEMWHFLECNYQRLNEGQRKEVLALIQNITKLDANENIRDGSTAYSKAIWLAAIREHGDIEEKLYQDNIRIAKTEPEHPDFSSYMSVGWVDNASPISVEELQALSLDDLVDTIRDYKDPGVFHEPGMEGLVKAFKQLIKAEPLMFYLQLNKFKELELAYIHEVIEGYAELWNENAKLPWNDLWCELLSFCLSVLKQERFWHQDNTKEQKNSVANRYWVVSSIGRLIQSGTKTDNHAFDEEHTTIAEEIIYLLLDNEKGNEFKIDSNAVSISINSPRGHCLEALINLALRLCRLTDKRNNKDHSDIWRHFQPRFDSELQLADCETPEYEFSTLVTNYLPNFLYMSKEWVMQNLSRIFDRNNYLKWLCAMQGYAYVGTVYESVYQYLKKHGDLLIVLDDENLKDKVEEKAVQNIVVAYLNNFEKFTDEDSLINALIQRNDFKEISHLIWFIWTLRKKDEIDLRNKVYDIWPIILNNIDTETREGRRIASSLCHWSVFVDHVDDDRRSLLYAIAPYADVSHNSYELLVSIADISKSQPLEAYSLWKRMLEGSTPDYPEDAIRQIFTNLVNEGPEGVRKARDIESEYLRRGTERPAIWLKEIRQEFEVL